MADEAPTEPRTVASRLRDVVTDALAYWERRRVVYSAVLAAIVLAHFGAAWPSSRSVVTFDGVMGLFLLAVLANVCYCAAYLVDIPMQRSPLGGLWGRRRWALWSLGMLLAIVAANYWIADEIYPSVR